MNRNAKDKLTGLGVKVGSNLIVRIILRRAERGGKFARRLVRFFGLRGPEQLEDAVNEAIDTTSDLRKKRK